MNYIMLLYIRRHKIKEVVHLLNKKNHMHVYVIHTLCAATEREIDSPPQPSSVIILSISHTMHFTHSHICTSPPLPPPHTISPSHTFHPHAHTPASSSFSSDLQVRVSLYSERDFFLPAFEQRKTADWELYLRFQIMFQHTKLIKVWGV